MGTIPAQKLLADSCSKQSERDRLLGGVVSRVDSLCRALRQELLR
jgi:hypothetical protein